MGYEYVKVEGRVANEGIATYANDSGRYEEGGYLVRWNEDEGFSGQGWKPKGSIIFFETIVQITEEMSPAYSYTQEQIKTEIETQGNLNTMFNKWPTNVSSDARYAWVLFMEDRGCATA
ncbi:MAG TPA: hypothetical protein IAB71_05160 [Candidatus Scatomonas pullistercoris]|uniref:Uncharacterized protein n=1 Tax=Candidatus Scatomonas pullistercoris TaxID=2840920 RepID=A0A9D1T9V0_9FIRM|nr:hypothetical protein [Candidatus Scatomonas pullistercoris]